MKTHSLPSLACTCLLLVASSARSACPPDDALQVEGLSPALAAQVDGLRVGDRLLEWLDAAGKPQPLCSLLDLARADLERGTLAPIALHVTRAGARVVASLAGGRPELVLQQRGDSAPARASLALLSLREKARRGEFAAARKQLEALGELSAASRALAVELAIGWLEADPDRLATFALAEELVSLRELSPARERARAIVLRGRAWLLRGDLAAAGADAAAARVLVGGERSLIVAQIELLEGAIGYVSSKHDSAEEHYRDALAIVAAVAPDSVAHALVLSNIAALHVARGHPGESYRDYDAAIRILGAAAPDSYAEARLYFNRGLASTELRRLAAAEADVEAAVERFARVQPGGPEHLQAQLQLANIYNARGQHALAEAQLRKLLPLLQAGDPDGHNTLALEYTLAYTISRLKRTDESLQAFRILLDKLGSDRVDSLRADVLNAYGQVLTETPALEDAVRSLGEALEIYESRQRHGLPMASALIARGATLLRLGRLDAARIDLDRGLEIRSADAPGSVLEAVAHHLQGKLSRAQGNVDEALSSYHRAIELLERERWKQSESAELRALWTASYSDLYREPLDLLLELGRLPQAFELDQHYRGRELAIALARPGIGIEPALAPEEVIDADAARARLGPNQGLLSFVTLPTHSWALLLDRRGLDARRLEHGKAYWREEVDALSVLWALPNATPTSEQAAVARSHRLHRSLFGAWDTRLDGIERLLLVPDDALHELAFAALATTDAPRAVDARYLVERFSLASLLRPFPRQPESESAAAKDSLLALGDPAAADAAPASRTAPRLRGMNAGALPSARREATEIAALYGERSRSLLGHDAVEAAVAGSDAGVLHFATHVVLDPLQPLDSYVLLAPAEGSDGRLSAGEIAGLRPYQRELVVLAGCASVHGANAAGEGLLGIARAWLVAGSQRVLASTWAIADEPTSRFMIAFHRALRVPLQGDVALAKTQREWLERARDRGWWKPDRSDEARPFFWAGFALSAAQP